MSSSAHHDTEGVSVDVKVEEEEELEADSDPVAEGEEAQVVEFVEPSTANADGQSFFRLCKSLENLWKYRRQGSARKRVVSETDKLKVLLPPALVQQIISQRRDDNLPQTMFPLLRLLMPEKDASRTFLMKETAITNAYVEAFNLTKQSTDYKSLVNYRVPRLCAWQDAVGDLTVVLQRVLEKRLPYDKSGKKGSSLTIGDINKALDQLGTLAAKVAERAADTEGPRTTLVTARANWIKKLKEKGMTPLEHKWLVRIILQNMQFGLGWRTVLRWYHRRALALYAAHSSLKNVCKTLCNLPDNAADAFVTMPEGSTGTMSSYIVSSPVPLTFGQPFRPMLSARTSFDKCLSSISDRHREFCEASQDASAQKKSLSFRHPAFSVETKLDGERMLVHLSREGIVKIHSRQGVWYSNIYSPVLGPSIRRAMAKYKLDVVLDGEILSWDSGREETVPFGHNRTVARMRRQWMEKKKLVDKRDLDLHDLEEESKTMKLQHFGNQEKAPNVELAGEECWLQFICFDVVYIDGPDAEKFLADGVSDAVVPCPKPGSIISLDAFERKRLLYKLIDIQEREVEIVSTWVIRPTGDSVAGSTYFSDETKEHDFPVSTVDSLNWTMRQGAKKIERIDVLRRRNMDDVQLSRTRAWAVNELYTSMVEDQQMEGLLFKDLATPYYLGEESKNLAYWHKFKPDYYRGAVASDLDLVVIGAYFATGLRHAGKPSSFLCACVDSGDKSLFFPLCKVNAGSMRFALLEDFFQSTGFTRDPSTGVYDMGKMWFCCNEEEEKALPDFITERSLITGRSDTAVWKPKKDDYPDMWIHPNDSRILTINAGEIVSSDTFSAGITLRFPRVMQLRNNTDKSVSEIEDETSLWSLYQETLTTRGDTTRHTSQPQTASQLGHEDLSCRFMTEGEYSQSKKKKRTSRQKVAMKVETVEKVDVCSSALAGLRFCVLDGTYALTENEAKNIKDSTWFGEVCRVRSKTAVMTFVEKHGGKTIITPTEDCFVVGGQSSDARVANYVKSIAVARREDSKRKKDPVTQQAKKYQKLARHVGVLSWLLLWETVYKRLAKQESSKGAATAAPLLTPNTLDYIARPGGDLLADLCEDSCLTHVSYLDRALRRLEQLEPTEEEGDEEAVPWYEAVRRELDMDEAAAVAENLVLWNDNEREVVVYPDLETRPSLIQPGRVDLDRVRIEAVLPIARIMGASVVDKFDATTVTHVLCTLGEQDEVQLTANTSEEVFCNRESGRRLLATIKSSLPDGHAVNLVSPQWVRKRKWPGDSQE